MTVPGIFSIHRLGVVCDSPWALLSTSHLKKALAAYYLAAISDLHLPYRHDISRMMDQSCAIIMPTYRSHIFCRDKRRLMFKYEKGNEVRRKNELEESNSSGYWTTINIRSVPIYFAMFFWLLQVCFFPYFGNGI